MHIKEMRMKIIGSIQNDQIKVIPKVGVSRVWYERDDRQEGFLLDHYRATTWELKQITTKVTRGP